MSTSRSLQARKAMFTENAFKLGLFSANASSGRLLTVVPERWRFLYSLNPMVGVIDGFRWCILGAKFEPYWPGVWASTGVIILLLASGLFYFRSTEKTFADVI